MFSCDLGLNGLLFSMAENCFRFSWWASVDPLEIVIVLCLILRYNLNE